MQKVEIIIQHSAGLHARPAAKFVRLATSFPCVIRVANLTKRSQAVNAKSILGVLSLGVDQGHQVCIETEGEREIDAAEALRSLVTDNFGEGVTV